MLSQSFVNIFWHHILLSTEVFLKNIRLTNTMNTIFVNTQKAIVKIMSWRQSLERVHGGTKLWPQWLRKESSGSSLRWFEACSCKPAPRDLPSSLVQLRGALTERNKQKGRAKLTLPVIKEKLIRNGYWAGSDQKGPVLPISTRAVLNPVRYSLMWET